MKITVNRTAVNSAISNMNLFEETKKVIAEYKEAVSKLDDQDRQLQEKLEGLQAELTANMLDHDNTEDLSELIYLNKQGRDILAESQVIESMLERIAEARTELKVKYVTLFREAISKDQQAKAGKFDATNLVIKLRYVLIEAIADIGKEMAIQYNEVEPDIKEIFEDKKVLEVYPQLKYGFNQESWKPTINGINEVITDSDIAYAKMGSIPSRITNPKNKEC